LPKIIKTFSLLFLLFASGVLALSREEGERFILGLAAGSSRLADFCLAGELAASERLSISYAGVENKFLIGYDLAPQAKSLILKDSSCYRFEIQELADSFALLALRIPVMQYERHYYFKGSKLVSPVYYHTRNSQRDESRYFSFYISDSLSFNSYAATRLDSFVESVLELLEFSAEQKERLRKGKIVYVLCRDEDQIQELTGFRIRGMYVLDHDYVVTTFTCHYHELVHLLVNCKLQNCALEIHPFFQEGIAVALGGRGGKEPEVILDLGYFLLGSELVELGSLLGREEFLDQDASFAYPASGLYNLFLLKELGAGNYLGLYRKYSGLKDSQPPDRIDRADLPGDECWQAFLRGYSQFDKIYFESSPSFEKSHPEARVVYQGENTRIFELGESYFFQLGDTLILSDSSKPERYRSSKFSELFGDSKYSGEKYLVAASPEEIGVYNLFNNNLEANFVSSFSWPPQSIPLNRGRVEFHLRKTVFDQPLSEFFIKTR